jgi:hypothetical protein
MLNVFTNFSKILLSFYNSSLCLLSIDVIVPTTIEQENMPPNYKLYALFFLATIMLITSIYFYIKDEVK